MSMSGRTQVALGAAAVVSLALSTVLVLLAVDVSRLSTALDSGDARYRWAPRDATLWQADDLVPGAVGARLLGIEDDRAFREAIRSLRTARLKDPIVSDPSVEIRRNEAQARLEEIVAGDSDSWRRSRAAGLLGVLGLARFVYEAEGRDALLSATVASLRLALELDPDNDEAKTNLEVAYQRGRALELSEGSAGQNPSPGGSGSKGAGAGDAGSGY